MSNFLIADFGLSADSIRWGTGRRLRGISVFTRLNLTAVAMFLVSITAFSVFASSANAACSKSKSLGVSRIVEIDNSKGLGLGSVQYREQGLLKPKEVILTFDDGPLPKNTNTILAALKRHCTKAVFFAVGRMAIAFPNSIKKIANEGHTVAVHTWNHPRLGRMSTSRAIANVERGFSAVRAAAGQPISAFFRFPYLDAPSSVREHLKRRNVVDWSIDVDSGDTRGYSSSRIVSATMARLKSKGGKGIILFHDIKPTTARAIAPLLNKLKASGYKIVHAVSKLPATTNAKYDAYYDNVLNARKKKRRSSAALEKPPVRAIDKTKPQSKMDRDQIFDPADLATIRKASRKRVARAGRTSTRRQRLRLRQKRRRARRPRRSSQAVVSSGDFPWPSSN